MCEVICFGLLRGTTGVLAAQELRAALAICSGLGNKEIARELSCSTSTVKKSIERVFFKLGVSSRSAVVAEAMRRGLVSFATPAQPEPDPRFNNLSSESVLIA